MNTVYTSATCGYCKQLKDYLKKHEVEYREVNVSESKENMEEFSKLGYMGVPVLVHQYPDPDLTEIIVGFNKGNLDRLFDKSLDKQEDEQEKLPL